LRKIIGIAAPARSGKDTVAAMLLQHKQVAAYALADPLKIGCQALFGLSDAETWDDSLKEHIIPLWEKSPRQFFQHVGTDWMRARNPDHWLMRAERSINAPDKNILPVNPPLLDYGKAPFQLAAQAFFDLSAAQTWDNTLADTLDPFWGLSPRQMFCLLEALASTDFPDYASLRAQRPLALPTREIPGLGESEIIIIKDIRFENEAEFLRRHNGKIWHIVRNAAEKVHAHASELGIAVATEDVLICNNGTLEQLACAVEQAWQNQMHI
jgi:hypothetical protein